MAKMEVNKPGPHVIITRRATFSAAHRLHSVALTDEENLRLYGKCNHVSGHGHNYVVEVSMRGSMDKTTGMVMNMTNLKGHIEKIVRQVDHKNLDIDVEFFRNKPSTAENLAIYFWDEIAWNLENPKMLYMVKVQETENNSATYMGV